MNLRILTGKVAETAAKAGRFILRESEKFDISLTERKGRNDFVSYVDREAERLIAGELGRILPEAGFLAEEETRYSGSGRYIWVVDPLDGTTNFIHGLHPFSVSIALQDGDEIISGVVYEVSGNEIFTAWKGGGAWLNGRRITVSGTSSLSGSLVATGFPYKDFGRLKSYLSCLGYLMENTHGIRRMGSAAIDLAYVACGRFDLFFEYNLNPWDVSAGTLLVREAGGTVTDFSGNERNITGKEIIASNSKVHSEMLRIMNKFMPQ